MLLRRFFASPLLLLAACCGSAEPADTAEPTTSPPAAAGEAPAGDAAVDAPIDDCTSRGYECHPNSTCNADFMPLSGISCGATGGYCCIKGAMPPSK